MSFSSLGGTLRKSIRASGIEPQVIGAQTIEQFQHAAQEIFGMHIAGRMNALYLKNKTLTVAVGSSVVGQELKLREKEIIQKLNASAGQNLVERIRFLV